MKRKIISLLLCLLMALSLIPTVAFAKDDDRNVIDYENTSTLTFKIENGKWNSALATTAGVQLSADQKTVTFPTYFHSNKIGYVYMCSMDSSTATNSAVLEQMLFAILKGNYEGYIIPDTGYDAAGLSAQDWSVEQGGITGSTATANIQMSTIYNNIHGYDTHMSPVGGFVANTIYKLTLTKSSYTIKYVDGVNGAAFVTQEYTANYNDDTPAFEGTPTREGYNFTGWNPKVAEKVTKDMTYTATWEKSTGDLTINKVFAGLPGVIRPESVTFTVTGPNDYSQNVTLTANDLTANGQWSTTLTGLTEGSYTLKETRADVPGYTYTTTTDTGEVEVTANGATTVTVTNTYVTATTSVTVTKVWEDVPAGMQPTSVEVKLAVNGTPDADTIVLNADNEWTHTFDNLPVKDEYGKDITYTVQENVVPAGYTAVVTGDAANGFTITNTAQWDDDEVNPATLTITKVDADATTQKLTGAVFTLTKQDAPTANTLTATTDKDGTCTFTGLTEGSYTLKETKAPDGYKQTNQTWTIVVERNSEPTIVLNADTNKFQEVYDCTVSELVGNDPSELTNGRLTITNEKAPESYSVTLPIQKIVAKKAGSNNPGNTTFAFAATMYDGQTETTTMYGTAAIETNGVGTYKGELKINVPADLFSGGNGSISLQVSEVKGTDSKWSYDDTVYSVLIQVKDYVVTLVEVNPEIAAQATDDEAEKPTALTFTNEYSYKYTPTPLPTPPRPVTSVKTGDMGVALYAVTSLLSLSGAAVIIKKRKDEE